MGLGQYVFPRFAVNIASGKAVPIERLRANCLWYPALSLDARMVSGHVLYTSQALHEAMEVSLAQEAGDHSLCEVDVTEAAPVAMPASAVQMALDAAAFDDDGTRAGRLTLRNIVPAPFLAPRIQAAEIARSRREMRIVKDEPAIGPFVRAGIDDVAVAVADLGRRERPDRRSVLCHRSAGHRPRLARVDLAAARCCRLRPCKRCRHRGRRVVRRRGAGVLVGGGDWGGVVEGRDWHAGNAAQYDQTNLDNDSVSSITSNLES